MLSLHALNARDNALLHWLFFERADSDPQRFQKLMQAEARRIRNLLASRGVCYEDLKSALVPTREGVQVVFLYDWWEQPSWNYAVAFAQDYLPCLRGDLRTSMLDGDVHSIRGGIPVNALEAVIVKPRPQPVNWQTQYGVYFSNLRSRDVLQMHQELANAPRYTGYIDVSFTSPVRDYLAQTVVPHWVMLEDKVVLIHDDDELLVSDEDPIGFDFPAHGYEVVSLIDSYFTAFLSYKIEAAHAYQAADDRILNLAAITGELIDVGSIDVFVHPDKLDKYLLHDENKLRLMTSIGLHDATADDLASVVRTKLLHSYVYDFRFAPDGTPLFAVAAEFERPGGGLTRRLLALKHDRSRGAISLVSMY